jgi:UDPglucose--hexose-1-phosphate uridylyltransferase
LKTKKEETPHLLLSSGIAKDMEIEQQKWEKRWHPLREEWIVYSAHRNSRPWQGAGLVMPTAAPSYDPKCYLCPGNKRVNDKINPEYAGVFIFENDLPVVGKNAPEVFQPWHPNDLYRKERALGVAKVICYDPRHQVTLSQVSLPNVVNVFEAFQNETVAFEKDADIKFVLIFENKGEAVGVSNPHPHCQVYATDFTFKLIEQQIRLANQYNNTGRNLFDDIIANEMKDQVRVIAENDHAIAFIPFFARYAYEVMIFPKKAHPNLIHLNNEELAGLAAVFHQVTRRMDMNFNSNFPYVMSVMQSPVDGGDYRNFRMHIWLQPPYRQPGLIKYLAGPEIGGGNFMADTMPEDKAAELRKVNLDEYKFEQ